MSTLRVNTIQDSTGSSSPAINGLAKAWVNFNGTGTVAIRAAFNVSSITDNGTGDYTVNFTNAMTDANYSATWSASYQTTGTADPIMYGGIRSFNTTSCTVLTTGSVAQFVDYVLVNVSVFR